MDLLALGRILHTGARLCSGGIAAIDSAVTGDFVFASWDRLAGCNRAEGKCTFADLECLRVRRDIKEYCQPQYNGNRKTMPEACPHFYLQKN
jgi:hypothetical protein